MRGREAAVKTETPFLLSMIEQAKMLSGPLFAAGIGHLMRFAEGAILADRVCWRRFIIESPSIIGFAIISSGLAEHFKLGYATACAIAAVSGWLGNAVIFSLLRPRIARWVEGQNQKTTDQRSLS